MDIRIELPARFSAAWASVTFDLLWPQLLMFGGCVLIAFLVRFLVNFWIKRSGVTAKTLIKWPLGLLVLTAALWLTFAVLTNSGEDAEPLRVVAIATGALTAIVFALRFIGATPLGVLLTIGAVTLGATEALYLTDTVVGALSAPGIALGGIRISPWFAAKAVVIVGFLFWGAQQLGDLLAMSMSRERILSRSGSVLFAKLARVALLAAAIVLSLAFLGVDVTALAVLSGAIGLGLGFGLQKIVSNYVAGLILLLDKSIKPGDVIELDFGTGPVRGEVTELAGRYTALTLRTGTEVLVPNEFLISTAVNNWSHTSRNVQLRLPVGVAYSTDVEKAMALCIAAARLAPRVLINPAPACLINGFGDSAVEFEVRFWISDSDQGIQNVSSGVYLQIWKHFREHGIEIPFPQRDLHIRSSVAVPWTKHDQSSPGSGGQ